MAAPVQQVGRCQPGGAGAHHRNLFAGVHRRGNRPHRAAGVAVFDDGVLVFPHGHRRPGGHAAGAGGFAQGRAYAAGEFRESVGGHQALQRQLPPSLVHQVVPFGNQVVQRAAAGHPADHHTALAERHAAVHAAGALGLLLFQRQRQVKFVKILDALFRRPLRAGLPGDLHKSGHFTHFGPPPYFACFMA